MEIKIRPTIHSLGIIGIAIAVVFAAWFSFAGFEWYKALLLGLLIAGFLVLNVAQLCATIRAQDDVLRIDYLLVSCDASIDDLSSEVSQKFDYRRDPEFGLDTLLLGTRLFGFHVGFYKLKDGSTAYVCLSRKKHARAITAENGFKLLLDPGIAKRVVRYCS